MFEALGENTGGSGDDGSDKGESGGEDGGEKVAITFDGDRGPANFGKYLVAIRRRAEMAELIKTDPKTGATRDKHAGKGQKKI